MCQLRSQSLFVGYVSFITHLSSLTTQNLKRTANIFSKQVVCLVDMAFIYLYCRYQNKLKRNIRAQPDYVKLENQEFLDLTDRENPEFEYTL